MTLTRREYDGSIKFIYFINMRKAKEKERTMSINGLVSFYSRQANDVLHACIEKHRIDIGKAIWDPKREYIHKTHLEAVKRVIRYRHKWV